MSEPEPATAAGPGEQTGPPPVEQSSAEMETLRADLEREQHRAQEYLDRWTRAQADLANVRRRTQAELDNMQLYASAELVRDLLPVLDSFERAFVSVPHELRHLSWIDGIWQINALLRVLLQRQGLEPIEALGKPFDPYMHEAVLREEPPAAEEVVVSVLQTGYKLHERVLRPALVKLGPRPPTAAVQPDQAAPAGAGAGTEQAEAMERPGPEGTP